MEKFYKNHQGMIFIITVITSIITFTLMTFATKAEVTDLKVDTKAEIKTAKDELREDIKEIKADIKLLLQRETK